MDENVILLRVNSQTELQNWIMLVQYGLSPIMRLNISLLNKLCGSLSSIYDFEAIQIDFPENHKLGRYFTMQPFLKHIRTK